MDHLRREIARWTELPPTMLALRAAAAVVIAVVPGALTVWVAYRLIRTRAA